MTPQERTALLDRLAEDTASTAIDLAERQARTDAGLDVEWMLPEPERAPVPEAPVVQKDFAGRTAPPAPQPAGLTRREVQAMLDRLAKMIAKGVGRALAVKERQLRQEITAAEARMLVRLRDNEARRAGRTLHPIDRGGAT